MIRDGYGQIVYETLPHILLSNASLVTKSCIARFVEGDAFNPSALSDCSTGPSPPLAHAKSTLSPSRASAGCLQPGLFGRFRSICEQAAHRSPKIDCCFLPLTWPLQWETLPETVLAGPGAAAPRPAVSRCGRPRRGGEEGRPDLSTTSTDASVVRSLTLSRLTKAKKQQSIYKCTQKCVISTAPKNTNPQFLEYG